MGGRVASKCDGINDCLEECTHHLRSCLEDIFPPSKSIEFENDKVDYLLFSIYVLANRLTKCKDALNILVAITEMVWITIAIIVNITVAVLAHPLPF